MLDQLVALIVDESKWLTASMGLAVLSATLVLYWNRGVVAPRRLISIAMNLFFGVTIGTMAFGHLLAVTTKLLLGTLQGSTLGFYAIGIALALPSWWLILATRKMLAAGDSYRRMSLTLNSWLGVTLLILGVHNLPLALPAVLNIGYTLHSRRAVGWAMVSLAVVVHAGLFVGSVMFLLSGQSFEQFRGID